MADWDTVRALASTLPNAEESTTYSKPAFKVKGKLFAWVSPDDPADQASAVRVDPDELALFVETSPDRCFQTPHYHGHPILLVRMDAISPEELAERIEDSWLLRAPRRLADEHVAGDA